VDANLNPENPPQLDVRSHMPAFWRT